MVLHLSLLLKQDFRYYYACLLIIHFTNICAQTQLAKKDSNGNGVPQYKGTYDAFKKIGMTNPSSLFAVTHCLVAKQEGLLTLWSGLMPSMLGLVHVAIQFPLYEKFKSMIIARSMYLFVCHFLFFRRV